jgi:hypothetical protein
MHSWTNYQTLQAVKEIACEPIPFANRENKREDEFQRVWMRIEEVSSNTQVPVLHDFSLAGSEVRRIRTSARKRGDIMQKTAIRGD